MLRLVRLRGLLALALVATACGDTAVALSGGVAPAPLITPTPYPSPTPFDCGQMPPRKCDVLRRVDDDQREAVARWQRQADRSYVPIAAAPFLDSPPQPTTAPFIPTASPEPAIRACSAADLAASLGGSNGAGGVSMRAVNIANQSGSPCGLKGRPAVRILAGASLARATYTDPDPDAGHLVVLAPGTGAPDAEHAIAGQAWTWVGWTRGCLPVWSGASTLILDLPRGGGALRIALPAATLPPPTPVPSAQCPSDAPYLQAVGAWEFQPRVEPATSVPAVPVLTAVANAPGMAVAGETFTFQVTLANPAGDDLRFSECPNFRIWISEGTDRQPSIERHQLNCAAVPMIPAHSSRSFDMRIDVPSDWAVTRNGAFGWGLEGYAGAAIKLPLIVARRS